MLPRSRLRRGPSTASPCSPEPTLLQRGQIDPPALPATLLLCLLLLPGEAVAGLPAHLLGSHHLQVVPALSLTSVGVEEEVEEEGLKPSHQLPVPLKPGSPCSRWPWKRSCGSFGCLCHLQDAGDGGSGLNAHPHHSAGGNPSFWGSTLPGSAQRSWHRSCYSAWQKEMGLCCVPPSTSLSLLSHQYGPTQLCWDSW